MIQNIDKNKYKITIECGFINSKRKRISRTIIGTKSEAKIKEAELIRESKSGNIYQKANITFKELSDMFIEDYCITRLKENTIFGYKNLLKTIIKEIGYISIKDITSYVLEKYYNKLSSKYNYSSNTIIHHYVLINNIFERAVKWQLLPINPNAFVDKPKLTKKEAKIYNYDELKELLNALEKEPIKYKAPILLCLDTGMRREELNALKWENINFINNEISIKQTRLAFGNQVITSTPKTEKSSRTIVASQVSIDSLKKLKAYQENLASKSENLWNNTGYVFVNDNGTPYYPDTLSKIFKKIIIKYNLPNITLHQLRHTSASLLINNNEDVASVSARLGHANTSTTLNMYTHALDKARIKTANTMNNILSSI